MNNNKRNLFLILLISRLGFIFFDVIFNKDNEAEKLVYFNNIGLEYQKHNAADTEKELVETNIEDEITKKIQNKRNNIQDIKTLERIYQKEGSEKILIEIIKKQAQNYNFNEARTNIEKLEEKGTNIDVQLLLYVYLNSNNLKTTQKDSIKKLPLILNKAIQNGSIVTEDYAFYLGLIEIRNKNYTKAIEQRKGAKGTQYQPIISSFERAIKTYDDSKAIPKYYQDGLVALAALKNGYFNIARKISVETAIQDENYILPYQVLAYAHFLTNNQDTAIEYFLKLANFDKQNTETYRFLIGVSYYWKSDFTSSILYLSQNTNTKYQTDIMRYLVINYLEINEQQKAIEIRQKLLGQSDIKNSDFFLYFYQTFYKGYFTQNTTIYQSNQQLSTLFIQECETKLGNTNDVCKYGKIGKSIIQGSLSENEENILEELSQIYNQSYLYHILGDFSNKNNKIEEAKKWYAKTIANSQDPKEIDFVQKKLSEF